MLELILGGQRSGKSRCAERRAAGWLAVPGRRAVMLATALPHDDEMRQRIERHRADRSERLPGVATQEVPHDLAAALRLHSSPLCLVIIDCLTLWLTNLLMPMDDDALDDALWHTCSADFCSALQAARGPVVMVSNEVGLGVSPLSREARRFIDELGRLHQEVAARCTHVTWMVAGLEMPVKRGTP